MVRGTHVTLAAHPFGNPPKPPAVKDFPFKKPGWGRLRCVCSKGVLKQPFLKKRLMDGWSVYLISFLGGWSRGQLTL